MKANEVDKIQLNLQGSTNNDTDAKTFDIVFFRCGDDPTFEISKPMDLGWRMLCSLLEFY